MAAIKNAHIRKKKRLLSFFLSFPFVIIYSNMRSTFIAIAAIATTFVSAQNIVSITSPLSGTVYTAGKAALISWIDASVDTIPAIVIAQGDPNALQPVQTIASNVDASAGSYTWNIPADFAPGTDCK
jgi:hypothetical protein